ncbi:endocuticle structural glycoprotein SgAbd-2-like [Pollicipes pollicipes]|uniref:endocuticle structural glycoprotein SgAbd-2-like n=1 Tax=Pollicipes pollicipes TaxID=41117 RepID=UPI0018855BE9|nr:endocuticle structural glycoprotein SgAbd-2-like [Pollicipes pollicipes]
MCPTLAKALALRLIVAFAVLAVVTAAPQYSAPQQGYGAPQSSARGTAQGPVYASGGANLRSAAQGRDAQARTLSEENINNGDGTYQFSFQTDNGISRDEQGDANQVTGSYSYTGDDGVPVSISFVADVNGFQPQGDVLPTPVPTEYPTPDVPLSPEANPNFAGRGQAQPSYSTPAAPSRFYGAA